MDGSQNVYIAGRGSGLSVKYGPDLKYNGGMCDGIIIKVNHAGTHLDYCGYIGGSGHDGLSGVDVDAEGNAYITGITSSTENMGFPVKIGPDLTTTAVPFL